MQLTHLLDACSGKSTALLAKTDLEPLGSAKIMPPIYLKAPSSNERSHWFEDRVIDGQVTQCAVLDSVQSQANRLEEALQYAVLAGELRLPIFRVTFPGHDPITNLTAPHRIYDAWLRHTTMGGVPFRQTDIGKAIQSAQPLTATALLRYAPTTLLFGGWDSQFNAKTRFSRAIAAEIAALGVQPGQRAASRIDPINLRVSLAETSDGSYRPGKKIKASKAGLASVAPHLEQDHGGISADRIEQTILISFTQLLRLRFPVDGQYSVERDAAGRAVVGALGLAAVHFAAVSGYALRSGCWLRPKAPFSWRLAGLTPDTDADVTLSDAPALYREAVEHASRVGLTVDDGVYELEPDAGLVEAVQANPKDAGEDE